MLQSSRAASVSGTAAWLARTVNTRRLGPLITAGIGGALTCAPRSKSVSAMCWGGNSTTTVCGCVASDRMICGGAPAPMAPLGNWKLITSRSSGRVMPTVTPPT